MCAGHDVRGGREDRVLDDVCGAPPVHVLQDVELQAASDRRRRREDIGPALLQSRWLWKFSSVRCCSDLVIGSLRLTQVRSIAATPTSRTALVRGESPSLTVAHGALELAQGITATQVVEQRALHLNVQGLGGIRLAHPLMIAGR